MSCNAPLQQTSSGARGLEDYRKLMPEAEVWLQKEQLTSPQLRHFVSDFQRPIIAMQVTLRIIAVAVCLVTAQSALAVPLDTGLSIRDNVGQPEARALGIDGMPYLPFRQAASCTILPSSI